MPQPKSKDVIVDEILYRIQNQSTGPLDLGHVEALDKSVRLGTANDDRYNAALRERVAAKVPGAADKAERDGSFIDVPQGAYRAMETDEVLRPLFDCGLLAASPVR